MALEQNLKLKQKLWEGLARENANRYIKSEEKGTEESYRESGRHDYIQFIQNDKYMNCQRCKPYRNVLEFGCGNGRMTEFIAEEYKGVFAVDISDEMLSQAKKKLSAFTNIAYIQTDGAFLPDNLKIDFIFSYAVLQHMTKDIIEEVFNQFHKVLKQKGIMKIQLRGKPTEPGHWCYGEFYTMEDACHLAQQTQFRIFKTRGEGERYFWLWLARL